MSSPQFGATGGWTNRQQGGRLQVTVTGGTGVLQVWMDFGSAIAARFRLSSAGGLAATGDLATDGEVEDYIFSFGPNAVTLRDFRAMSGGQRGVALAAGLLLLAAGGTLSARRKRLTRSDD